MYQQKIGPLDCVLAGPPLDSNEIELVVLFCHGFGAPGTDLVPLTDEIISSADIDRNRVLFVYPAAPLELETFGGFDGRAWWLINMQALQEMTGANDFSELKKSIPPGLIEAREMLKESLQELFDRTKTGFSNLIIGGFSQGAMLTAETVLNAEENPVCLVQMSGTLICEDQWRDYAQSHSNLEVLQSHGRIDPVLPYAGSEWLRDLFLENGCRVEFLPFHGVHTISMEMIQAIGNRIASYLKSNVT